MNYEELAKVMPSSLNDACRTIDVMADEIASLKTKLASANELAESLQRRLDLKFDSYAKEGWEAKIAKAKRALERVTVFHVEGDDRTHIRVCGEETLPANRGTSLQRALLEFDAIQRSVLKDLP